MILRPGRRATPATGSTTARTFTGVGDLGYRTSAFGAKKEGFSWKLKLPSTGKSFAALVDRNTPIAVDSEVGTKLGTITVSERDQSLEVVVSTGEPRRNRTFNLQIKSLLLCQLS